MIYSVYKRLRYNEFMIYLHTASISSVPIVFVQLRQAKSGNKADGQTAAGPKSWQSRQTECGRA